MSRRIVSSGRGAPIAGASVIAPGIAPSHPWPWLGLGSALIHLRGLLEAVVLRPGGNPPFIVRLTRTTRPLHDLLQRAARRPFLIAVLHQHRSRRMRPLLILWWSLHTLRLSSQSRALRALRSPW